eukprot:755602-Hanusia_phi.AAC.2
MVDSGVFLEDAIRMHRVWLERHGRSVAITFASRSTRLSGVLRESEASSASFTFVTWTDADIMFALESELSRYSISVLAPRGHHLEELTSRLDLQLESPASILLQQLDQSQSSHHWTAPQCLLTSEQLLYKSHFKKEAVGGLQTGNRIRRQSSQVEKEGEKLADTTQSGLVDSRNTAAIVMKMLQEQNRLQQFLKSIKPRRKYKIVLAKVTNWTIPGPDNSRDDFSSSILKLDHIRQLHKTNATEGFVDSEMEFAADKSLIGLVVNGQLGKAALLKVSMYRQNTTMIKCIERIERMHNCCVDRVDRGEVENRAESAQTEEQGPVTEATEPTKFIGNGGPTAAD